MKYLKISEHIANKLMSYEIQSISIGDDLLTIILDSDVWLASPVDTNHILEYRGDGYKHRFVTISTLCGSLIKCSSPWLYEHLTHCSDDVFGQLNQINFRTTKMVKAFLAKAKQEIFNAKNKKLTLKDQCIKIKHISELLHYCKLFETPNIPPKEIYQFDDLIEWCENYLSECVVVFMKSDIPNRLSEDDVKLLHNIATRYPVENYVDGLSVFRENYLKNIG